MSELPEQLATVLGHGMERTLDYQDESYSVLFRARAQRLIEATDLFDHRAVHALVEAVRRLALWMAYEDIPRVADLKSRQERFDRIRDEVQLAPGQVLTVTEYMKPRARVRSAGHGSRFWARGATSNPTGLSATACYAQRLG